LLCRQGQSKRCGQRRHIVDDPVPWRHGLYLGTYRAPVLQARQTPGIRIRRHALAPRPRGRPLAERGTMTITLPAYESIKVASADGVGVVTIDRPPRNALVPTTMLEI